MTTRLSITLCFALFFFVLTNSLKAEHIPAHEFDIAEGFEATVWATTPQLFNPTNFDIDADGRIWVTEAVNYRNFRNNGLGLTNKDGDRIVVLQDTDSDGKADASHTSVSYTHLTLPTKA